MMLDKLQMGAYGAYVWSCFALSLIGLVWIGLSARFSWRRELVYAQRRAAAAALEGQQA